jgi:hypothetical protein
MSIFSIYQHTLISAGYLALSSCLGNDFRARIAGFSIDPRYAAYDRHYVRTMASGGSGMSEQIELQDMMEEPVLND